MSLMRKVSNRLSHRPRRLASKSIRRGAGPLASCVNSSSMGGIGSPTTHSPARRSSSAESPVEMTCSLLLAARLAIRDHGVHGRSHSVIGRLDDASAPGSVDPARSVRRNSYVRKARGREGGLAGRLKHCLRPHLVQCGARIQWCARHACSRVRHAGSCPTGVATADRQARGLPGDVFTPCARQSLDAEDVAVRLPHLRPASPSRSPREGDRRRRCRSGGVAGRPRV